MFAYFLQKLLVYLFFYNKTLYYDSLHNLEKLCVQKHMKLVFCD